MAGRQRSSSGAIAAVALVVGVLTISFAGRGQAQTAPPVIEVSNTCAVFNTSTVITIWGSKVPGGTHTLTSQLGWFPSTQVPPNLGNFAVTVPYHPTDTATDEVLFDGEPTGTSIHVVQPGGCPIGTPPTQPCFATSAAVPVSVSALLPATETGSARWFSRLSRRRPDACPISDLARCGRIEFGASAR